MNERRLGAKTVNGSAFKAGRCWLHYGGGTDREGPREAYTIRFEWALGWHFGAHVELDPEETEITFNLAPVFGTFYLTFARDRVTRWLLNRLLPYTLREYQGRQYRSYEKREIGFYMANWRVGFFVWANRDSWSSSDPKWKQFSIDILDALFGMYDHTHETLEPQRDTLIPMLEGQYPAKVRLERRTWKRKRWPWRPFTAERVTYEFEIPDGIPCPGKGENAWDCGDDALLECGFSAPNEAGAIAQVVATVLTDRLKHGGRACMLRPWRETPLERAERSASIRARRAAEDAAEKHSQGNP